MNKKELKIWRKSQVRNEFAVKVLSLIHNFESSEVPDYKKLTKDDIISVLSSIIHKKTS